MKGMSLSKAVNIFQLSTYLKTSICMAKTLFYPINKDHATNFEIQLDKRKMEISDFFC